MAGALYFYLCLVGALGGYLFVVWRWNHGRVGDVEFGLVVGRGRMLGDRFAVWARVLPHMTYFSLRGVVGDFADYVTAVEVEAGTSRVFDRDVQGSEDELGALEIDGVAEKRVDDFHERGLDGFFAFEEGDGVQARARRPGDATVRVLVEVAELGSAKSGGAAADSVDPNMSASVVI